MTQTLSPASLHPEEDCGRTCLLSDEAFEQLYDLVSLFGKQPVFTPDIAVYDRELRYTESSPVVVPLIAVERP